LEFNVSFQHKHGYIRDDVTAVALFLITRSTTARKKQNL